jgi:hypothetical protein
VKKIYPSFQNQNSYDDAPVAAATSAPDEEGDTDNAIADQL